MTLLVPNNKPYLYVISDGAALALEGAGQRGLRQSEPEGEAVEALHQHGDRPLGVIWGEGDNKRSNINKGVTYNKWGNIKNVFLRGTTGILIIIDTFLYNIKITFMSYNL